MEFKRKAVINKPQNAEESSSTSTSSGENDDILIAGLPNHLAQLCLSRTPPWELYSVCRSWRRLIYSHSFPPFYSLYAIFSSSKTIEFMSLDPIISNNSWKPLPPPCHPPLPFLHNHPSFLSRKLPIQSLTVSGHLVLVAATAHHFIPALSSPLVFHPMSARWFYGPPLQEPRRWCATGSMGGAVYVASGVGSHYKRDVARSMEQWDLKREVWEWEKKASLRDGRFCREAIEAVGYRGKLCMVNVRGNAAKEGVVYEVASDKWEGMPGGMVAGWKGPAAAVMDEEMEMYVVNENEGVLSRYNGGEDKWEKVMESEQLKGAEQIVAGRGRVCAACEDGKRIVVVDVTAAEAPTTVWLVEPPQGLQVVAVHILPRMSSNC